MNVGKKQIAGMWFPETDDHFPRQMANAPIIDGKGTYQVHKYAACRQYFHKRRVALDIGGHVGLWSRIMAKDFERVIAFEPLRAHVECFQMNLEGIENVRLNHCALGDKPGKIRVHMPIDNTGHAHVLSDEGEEVACRTLDSYLFENVDFIKIDTEGFESFILEGGKETILRNRPLIVVEQKPGNAERYGRGQMAAVLTLRTWGMEHLWSKAGDYLMGWPGARPDARIEPLSGVA